MMEKDVTLTNPSGLHARPAAQFVAAASKFKGTTVKVVKEGKEVDCKSILGIMGLGATKGTVLTIKADGPDEQAAVDALVSLIESGFGEG
ncbi:MAG: HPr family phosphocarrier protein [Mycobacterium leprae]